MNMHLFWIWRHHISFDLLSVLDPCHLFRIFNFVFLFYVDFRFLLREEEHYTLFHPSTSHTTFLAGLGQLFIKIAPGYPPCGDRAGSVV